MADPRTPAIGQVVSGYPHATGRFYSSPLTIVLTTFTMVLDTLYAIPFLVPVTKTYTSLNIEVTTQAAGKLGRMGIWQDSSGAPGALELDPAATISFTGTGVRSHVISHQLVAGNYWLGIVSDGGPVVRAVSNASGACLASLGFTSGTDTTLHPGWSVALTFPSTLPNPFTGGGALATGALPRLMAGW